MNWGGGGSRHPHRAPMRKTAGATAQRNLGVAVVAISCALLVSCGGEPQLVPPASLTPVPTFEIPVVPLATPARADILPQVGDIVWAAAIDPVTSAPTDPVSSYLPEAPQIIAAAPAHSLPAGSRVKATWEYNDTSLDAFATELVPTDTIEETWVAFHLDRDPNVPWPVGVYEVTVSLEGTVIQRAAVEVTGQA